MSYLSDIKIRLYYTSWNLVMYIKTCKKLNNINRKEEVSIISRKGENYKTTVNVSTLL